MATRTQRRPITLDGTGLEIRFVKRRVHELDADLTTTVLGEGKQCAHPAAVASAPCNAFPPAKFGSNSPARAHCDVQTVGADP